MIKKCLNLITKNDKKNLVIIFILTIILGLFEFISIGSIPLVVGLFFNYENYAILLNKISLNLIDLNILNNLSEEQLAFFLAILLFIIFSAKTTYTLFFIYFETRVQKQIVSKMSNKLLKMYLCSPYMYFKFKKSGDIIRNINDNIDAVKSIIGHILRILREIFAILAIFILLVLNNFSITLGIFSSLILFTILFYFFVSPKLFIRGKKLQNIKSEVYKIISESVNSLNHIKILKKENIFYEYFRKKNENKYSHIYFSRFFGQVPRILLELLIVIMFILIILYYLFIEKNLLSFLPFMALFLASAARLLPSFNIFNGSFSQIKYQIPNLNKIYDDYNEMLNMKKRNIKDDYVKKIQSESKQELVCQIENMSFSYDNKSKLLNDINLTIKKSKIIGIYGESGTGKSTFVEILMGLIKPTQGNIKMFYENNLKSAIVGYIPQDIFLLDDTIEKNIALQFKRENIDQNKIDDVIKLAQLESFVQDSKNGKRSKVGERSSQISGGQSQRIAIARSLYHDFQLLIMDEATSALDDENENKIINCIKELKKINKSIIIISHNNKIFKFCDEVYKIENCTLLKQ